MRDMIIRGMCMFGWRFHWVGRAPVYLFIFMYLLIITFLFVSVLFTLLINLLSLSKPFDD